MTVVAFVISILSLLVAAWAAWATHRQAGEMRAQTTLLRGELSLARQAQSADAADRFTRQLSAHTRERDYLKQVSSSEDFRWDDAQKLGAAHDGIESSAIKAMLELVDQELTHPTFANSENTINDFLREARPALDQILQVERAWKVRQVRRQFGIMRKASVG